MQDAALTCHTFVWHSPWTAATTGLSRYWAEASLKSNFFIQLGRVGVFRRYIWFIDWYPDQPSEYTWFSQISGLQVSPRNWKEIWRNPSLPESWLPGTRQEDYRKLKLKMAFLKLVYFGSFIVSDSEYLIVEDDDDACVFEQNELCCYLKRFASMWFRKDNSSSTQDETAFSTKTKDS